MTASAGDPDAACRDHQYDTKAGKGEWEKGLGGVD